MKKHYLIVVYALLWMLSCCGCTPKTNVTPTEIVFSAPHQVIALPKGLSWRVCRFKIAWPEGSRINFTADLMLAHSVVKPVLAQYAQDIFLWRFHRRAARDQAGHQFSFMFYSDEKTAQAVMAQLEISDILKQSLDTGLVEKIVFDDPEKGGRPDISDTSDSSWSMIMQKNWPMYIMGVSALWLGLIHESMAGMPVHDGTIDHIMAQYRRAETAITKLWEQEGQHALLHHLNAIFGYERILIKKRTYF